MKLIIQLPCLNEAKTLEVALNDLPKHIDGIDEIEILIVNDGSTDNTVEVAKNWGVNHIVSFTKNRGLAKGFMAGIDECLRQGADIIVNTDADNQYCGSDIEKLIKPIMEGNADIVVGARPIDETQHFSALKKKLQHLGSWAVRRASKTDIPDAPSGFRAYSRDAAMRLVLVNDYTYTLEQIVQAGRSGWNIVSVPIRTNAELRPSRLFNSMLTYVKRSMLTIFRAYIMYKPLKFFTVLSAFPLLSGIFLGIRFLVIKSNGGGGGNVQSLILCSLLITLGVLIFVIGIFADTQAANRKIMQEVSYHLKKIEYSTDLNKAIRPAGTELVNVESDSQLSAKSFNDNEARMDAESIEITETTVM